MAPKWLRYSLRRLGEQQEIVFRTSLPTCLGKITPRRSSTNTATIQHKPSLTSLPLCSTPYSRKPKASSIPRDRLIELIACDSYHRYASAAFPQSTSTSGIASLRRRLSDMLDWRCRKASTVQKAIAAWRGPRQSLDVGSWLRESIRLVAIYNVTLVVHLLRGTPVVP